MVNGLGATPPEELYVIYRKVHQRLTGQGLEIYRPMWANMRLPWKWPGLH
jgi:dihydroxyacetone kinase